MKWRFISVFANLIFYNKSKVEQYKTLITNKAPQLSSGCVENENQDNNVTCLLECTHFEELLKDREDFFDFTGSGLDTHVKDIKLNSIIKVKGEIYVPEAFDMIHIIEQYKSLLIDSMDYQDNDEKRLVESVLCQSRAKIPLFCELGEECDYWLGIGKVEQENLFLEYNDLEDLEGQEVTIIAKLEGRKYYKDTPLKVFDIYKDFLGLNRTLRKQLSNQKTQDFESITIEEDYLGLELLAIY